MIHLRSIAIRPDPKKQDVFPFTLPLVRTLKTIKLHAPVTFFVGENGSGKSTLLESLAASAGSITVGGEDVLRDATLAPARALARCLRLTWNKKSNQGFFLRAEDFFNFARKIHQTHNELEQIAEEFKEKFTGYARLLAMGAALGQVRQLEERYGADLNANSHGESFLKLFQTRFVPGGLYLLDEPEAPLSPLRQLAFLSLLKKMVAQQGQFIIATHSPILMAYPGAAILSFDQYPIGEVSYGELEHVTLTLAILNNPDSVMRRL